jgi:bacterioferritin-associated ferredoxin
MKRLICLCNQVAEKEIHMALKKGARSVADIQKLTRAGTSCGRCLVIIDDLVNQYISTLPLDGQQRIDFE